MKKLALSMATLAAFALTTATAEAGGWGGHSGNKGTSHGLVNVSPSIGLGEVKVLNGTSVLNGSPILSGNGVSGILSGNGNGILGNGILNGGKIGILGGNRHGKRRGRH